MNNLTMYNKYAQPPKDALKEFNNGRFKGTDINPMWRIKVLTEEYGECGIGWYCVPKNHWRETAEYDVLINGKAHKFLDIAVFYEVELYVKRDNEWSKPIYGVGGNSFSEYSKKQGRIVTSDEAYKMAYTDAIGIACKALGIGADVWWKSNDSKYTRGDVAEVQDSPLPKCEDCGCEIKGSSKASPWKLADWTKTKYGRSLCDACAKAEYARQEAQYSGNLA